MSLNLKFAVYRGTLASLQALATTGTPGVIAWTTDSNEIFVDIGSGVAGTGVGGAWQRVANDNAVFDVANPAGLTGLANAKVGDFARSTSDNNTYLLTAYPASSAGNWKIIAATSSSASPGFTDVQSLGPSSYPVHEFVMYIDSNGVQHLGQPSFSDISGNLSQTQLPATIGVGSTLTLIDCGTF